METDQDDLLTRTALGFRVSHELRLLAPNYLGACYMFLFVFYMPN